MVRSTNHFYQWLPEYQLYYTHKNHPGALWLVNLLLLIVYEEPLGYAEGSPLTLHDHFIQLYIALNTIFSEYY